MAIVLISMYFVGAYMVKLDYYSDFYHTLPQWHKSAGILIAACLLIRFFWNYSQQRPNALSASPLGRTAATLAHLSLYLLVAVLVISGYVISTAKGAHIDVFGVFSVPALPNNNAEYGEIAGDIHRLAGNTFIGFVAVHAIAALYHHFLLKDATLKRMLNLKGQHS